MILGDARQIPLEDQSVGAIYSNSVLEHIPQVEKVFPEAFRILKNGGYFVFTVNSEFFGNNLFGTKLLNKLKLKKIARMYSLWRPK